MKTEKFEVKGMTCAACVSHVEKSVTQLQGVKSVTVNLLTNSMNVTFDELNLEVNTIEKSVERSGYSAKAQSHDLYLNSDDKLKLDAVTREQKSLKQKWQFSLIFLIPLMYVSMWHMLGLPFPEIFASPRYAFLIAFFQFWLTLPVLFINRGYFTRGFKTLFRFSPNMDSLVAIGSSAAVVYGIYGLYRIMLAVMYGDLHTIHRFADDLYFESAATILTLVTFGKFLEAKSKLRTSEAITRLMDLVPKVATVMRHKVEMEIPVEEVLVNEIVVVRPGQQIPVDGIVFSGSTSVDESAITGESIPVYKEKGSKVYSASINKSGSFTLRATKVGKDTTLSQIIQLVEDASASKAPISKLADRISSVFVPIVIAIAIVSVFVWRMMGYDFEFCLSIGIAVLVISCPCALGLATPVAIMVGTGKGAEHGILIKTAESLQQARTIDTIVLDKTGTITEGKPSVTNILSGDNLTEDELLLLAASLEKPSEHPLGEAIIKESQKRNLKLKEVDKFISIQGMGIEAFIEGEFFQAGNLTLMKERQVKLYDFPRMADTFSDEGKSVLFLANQTEVLGVIAVADTLKSNSIDAITQFKAMGLDVIMLTGDNAKTAAAIQSLVGISQVISDVLPQDKDQEIQKLQSQGKIVAMVGDGINDAPALMRSNLGIAIGAGTDIAIESADIVLMRSDLLDAVTTLRLSKAVMVNIKENLFWAFIYNIIGIPLAAGVFYESFGWKLSPMFAAAAMSFSSLTVVLNALRLIRFKPSSRKSQDILTLNTNISNMTEKKLIIEGMTCAHCSGRVEQALNGMDGVTASVDLKSNSATVKLTKSRSNEELVTIVEKAGYKVSEIK